MTKLHPRYLRPLLIISVLAIATTVVAAPTLTGKVVQVDDLGKDRYGRTLGIVRLDTRNINLELVREGWAWWYRKYAPKNKELAAAEAAARKAKRGLCYGQMRSRSRRGTGGRMSVRGRAGRTWTPATG